MDLTLASVAQQPQYLRFHNARFVANFMVKSLNGNPHWDHVFAGAVTPYVISLHGNFYGEPFHMHLYKVGSRTVLMKYCMVAGCDSQRMNFRTDV